MSETDVIADKKRGRLRDSRWVAERLGVPVGLISVWVHRGQLPGVVRLNRRTVRVDEDVLEAWLSAGGTAK
jgi:excisionase family DNA binding protein